MVYIDWKRIMAITPETFGEDDKEELLESVAWYTPTSEVGRKQLTALLKVIQEVLKYKSEQVESLMSALDELASKQGEEVARGRQELLDEIEDLREQLEYQKRMERDSGVSDDQLRSELVRLEMQNEELVSELQEREKDLVNEKSETERLIGQVAQLEREKLELTRELSAFQEESSDRRGYSIPDSPDGSTEKVEELVEIVRQKNKHIMQLLDDVEAMEQDNKTLRVKLTTTRNELTDANNTIAELTQQTTTLKIAVDDAERKCHETENKNKALASQVDELIEKKAKNDRDLDDFALKLNERVEEWKKLLDAKDSEISRLKHEVEKCMTMDTPWIGDNVESEVRLRLIQQEQEISKLYKTVLELRLENSEYLTTIKQLQDKISSNQENIEAAMTIARLQQVVQSLESQLIIAEEDATKKSEEISDLVVQVRAYEKHEFGLTEAMEKVKKLEKRLLERDSKIENLVAACNKLGIERGNLEDENAYLKEKLGLSPSHIIDSGSVKSRSESHAQTVKDLKDQVERLNNQIIEIKLKNREIKSQLEMEKKKEPVEESPLLNKQDQLEESQALQQRHLELVEENDALRKGMHEILESLQNQTLGELEAKSLERLLEALDARHVSGWYHPAMRLQAQLHSVQGECRELRSQVGALRKENLSLSHDLEAAKTVVVALDDQLRQIQPPQENNTVEYNQPKPSVAVDVEMEQKCVDLEIALRESKLYWDKAEADWERERRGLIKERDALAVQLGAGVESQGPPEAIYVKTIEFLNRREEYLENELDKLRENFIKMEQDSLTKISSLEKAKSLYLLQIRAIENQMIYQEPAEKVTSLEKELAVLKVKYNATIALAGNKAEETFYIPDAPSFSETEREEMLEEIKKLKEKLHNLEAQLNCYGENVVTPDTFNNQLTILSSKLAASEVLVSSEKTKRVALERCYESIKTAHVESKEQIADLMQQVHDLSVVNSTLQEALLGVESQIINDAMMRYADDKRNELEAKCETLLLEKKNTEELLEMSRCQCRSLQSWKNTKSMERDILTECLKVMEGNGSEKLATVRLSQELVAEKTRCLEMNKKYENAQAIISQLLSDNIDKETKIYNFSNEAQLMKTQNIQHFKILYQLLVRLHSACSEAFCFPTLNRAVKIMSELEQNKRDISMKLEEVKEREQELRVKDDEMQVQLDALHDLKTAFHSDAKNLISWHNKTTDLRLKETRYRRQNQYLTEQVQRLDEVVRILKEEAAFLEERTIEREREWEERLKQWECSQLALCQLMGGNVNQSASKDNENSDISQLESQVTRLQQQNSMLTEEMEQKEAVFREKLAEKVFRPKSAPEKAKLVIADQTDVRSEESEKIALMVTVNSLQAIIKQKEEAVFRYQELLKKSRQEHAGAMRRLQNELRNVHNALAMQSKAYSRLKHGVYQPASADVEKYVIKIQELEEELTEVQGKMTRASSQFKSSQQEADKWRKIAEEREASLEETQERMELEIDRYREEVHSCQMETQQLREVAQGGQTRALIDTISELQRKLSQYGERMGRPVSARKATEIEERGEVTSDEPLRRQLKASREECARLRDQVKALKDLKRRPSTARVPENKDNLVDKIRKLEETLQLSKQHEQELEEKGLKRIRSVEEVTRWDERKRFQKTLEKLQAKLKQKEVEATVAVNKLETMRGLMAKMERDKGVLETQVRSLTESARESSRMEKLMTEKASLAAQVKALEEDLEALRRHEGGKTAVILHTKLEDQERQIAQLQLANQAPQVLAAELERLQGNISLMKNKSFQLETENSTLKLSLERSRDENDQLRKTCRQLELQTKANLVSFSKNSPSRNQVRTSYEMQREVSKIKEDLKLARDRLSITVERNADLEQEIQRLRSQLSLWEEKDLADTLARTNQQQMISELHQELIQVKAQLAHKVHLLERVKILLSKAAAKEKALSEKVFALQSLVPPGGSS